MRTTLSLDDDVSSRLNQLQKRSRKSMKNLVNESLRAGLAELEKQSARHNTGYRITPAQLGKKLPDLDNIADILAMDDETN